MLKNLLNSVGGELLGSLGSKFNLDTDTAQKSVDLAKDTVTGGFTDALKGGDIGSIMSLFKGGADSSNSFVAGLISKYDSGLISKLGLSPNIAKGISSFVIPFIMQKFAGQAKADGKANESGIMDMLSDVGGSSIMGGLKDKLGGLGNMFGK